MSTAEPVVGFSSNPHRRDSQFSLSRERQHVKNPADGHGFHPEVHGLEPFPGGSAMIRIRPAVRADCPAILEIYNEAVLNTTASYDYEPRTLDHRRKWFDDHQESGFPIFVADDENGRIVGWSALNRYHDRKGYRFTTENSVYIAADRRGQGIGKLLLEPLIDSAKELGLHAIIAAIDGENEASIRLHRKFGFEIVGRFKEVGYKFDRWLDVVYMELLIRAPTKERHGS